MHADDVQLDVDVVLRAAPIHVQLLVQHCRSMLLFKTSTKMYQSVKEIAKA